MAFFTRVNLNVPVLPNEEASCESGPGYKRFDTDSNSNKTIAQSIVLLNNASSKTNTNGHTSNVTTTTSKTSKTNDDRPTSDSDSNSVVRELERNEDHSQTIPEGDETEEPKRYEYVIDRVLGVEV